MRLPGLRNPLLWRARALRTYSTPRPGGALKGDVIGGSSVVSMFRRSITFGRFRRINRTVAAVSATAPISMTA